VQIAAQTSCLSPESSYSTSSAVWRCRSGVKNVVSTGVTAKAVSAMTVETLSETKKVLYGYVDNGWHIFPVCWFDDNKQCACGYRNKDTNKPHEGNNIGKAPFTRNGLKDATTTHQGIDGFIRKYPKANWAGWFPGMLIPDIDPKHGGYESLEMLEIKIGKLPKTRTHLTGSGGLHIIFKQPDGYDIRNTVTLAGYSGIDRRGNGGYIVLPPSSHISGGCYEVIDDAPIIEAPKALLDLSTEKISSRGKIQPIPGDILEGTRNQTLASLAGSMRRRDIPPTIIESALREINKAQCKPPLSDNEVHSIAESIGRYSSLADSPNKAGDKRNTPIFDWHEYAVTHDALLNKQLKPIEFLIEGMIISCGTGVLAGPKKKGKSWMAMQLSQAVASGDDFLGHKTKQGSVIHFALEDGERRTQKRLRQQKTKTGLPVIYFYKWPAWNTPLGFAQLKSMILELKPSLIVVDTLGKCLNGKPDQNSAGDMGDFGNRLHDLALELNVMILFIAHHGKMSTRDPGFDIRGSSAIPGATDVNIGLYKNEDGTFELIGEGRDIEEFDFRVKLDKDNDWKWTCEGDARDIRRSEGEKKIWDAIFVLSDEADAIAIAKEIGTTRENVQQQLKRMRTGPESTLVLNPVKKGKTTKNYYKLLTSLTLFTSVHYLRYLQGKKISYEVNDVSEPLFEAKSNDAVSDVS
jgi:putative DNA primase/helicase